MADPPDLDIAGRQEAELGLLEAMYPDTLHWSKQRQELTYRPEEGGVLTLRLPNDYPGTSSPELVSATSEDKTDLRNLARSYISALELSPNEESLDAIIQGFDELVKQRPEADQASEHRLNQPHALSAPRSTFTTVIIWLHHLINTNKRKLALNPSVNPGAVTGITKPGYPGVLVYSGTADAIEAHVAELRNQRWQAFHVRYHEPAASAWKFAAAGIVEVESMSEVTKNIVDEDDKQTFLRAIGVK